MVRVLPTFSRLAFRGLLAVLALSPVPRGVARLLFSKGRRRNLRGLRMGQGVGMVRITMRHRAGMSVRLLEATRFIQSMSS